MKQIELTQGQYAIVDDEDYDYLSQWEWNVIKGKYTNYAERTDGKHPHRKHVLMHRVIMNTPDNLDTDHKDGNGLNNQKYNLRNCTRSQNTMNSKVRSNNKLGERCISLITMQRKKYGERFQYYRVRIRIQGKPKYEKDFKNLEEAKADRDAKLKEYYGEYSRG